MRLFCHIGPHKTATTSLQTSLGDRFRSGSSSYYYPEPTTLGPGHAELARRFLGLHGIPLEPDAIDVAVEDARTRGYDKVVVSSEEFGRAHMTDPGFAAFAALADRVQCELIVTLSPLRGRLVAELQEQVKHGRSFAFYDERELLEFMKGRPGLRPDFLANAVLATAPCAVSVILVDKSRPRRVFEAMSTILDEDLVDAGREPGLANPSMPYLQTVWLSELNRLHGPPARTWQETYAIVDAAFATARELLPAVGAREYPELPRSVADLLDDVWQAQLDLLRALEAAGRLRCFW